PSDQRPVSGSHHPPWVSEVDNYCVHAGFVKPLSRIFVVKSHQRAKSRLVDIRLCRSQELRSHLVSEHLAVWSDPPGQRRGWSTASSSNLQYAIPVSNAYLKQGILDILRIQDLGWRIKR